MLLAAGIGFAVVGQFLTLDQGMMEIVAKGILWLGFLGLCWLIVGGTRPRGAGVALVRSSAGLIRVRPARRSRSEGHRLRRAVA